MSLRRTSHWTLALVGIPLSGLLLLARPSFSQSSEGEATSPQSSQDAANPRGRETQHQEAGSVEASAPAMRDKLFLRQAVASGMLEMQLSLLAQRKASGDDVKEFAAHLVADHSRMEEALRSAAEAQGVMLPTKLPSQEQAVYERVNGLSGDAFDREYIKTIADNHHRDLREFRSEGASTLDTNLRTTVQEETRTIHQHMVVADQIARSKGVQNARPARVAASSPPQ